MIFFSLPAADLVGGLVEMPALAIVVEMWDPDNLKINKMADTVMTIVKQVVISRNFKLYRGLLMIFSLYRLVSETFTNQIFKL